MKNNIKVILLVALSFTSSIYFTCCQSSGTQETTINDEITVPALLKREKSMGNASEKAAITESYNKAVTALKENTDDLKQYVKLATVFVSEGRITGEGNYYSSAAMQMVDKVINENSANKDLTFQALNIKSAVLLSMHQFKDAYEVAKKAEAISNTSASVYGALVDANVELGNYQQAVLDCDKMLAIRPDLRSYSRASYLRQIHGDNAGAIDAMKMAVEAGGAGDENTEWARVTLGDLYLNIGKIDTAEYVYKTALAYRANYPYAEMGLAKVEKAKKNYEAAIKHTENAINTMSESSFVAFLADLYELKGDNEKATEVRRDVISLLEDADKENERSIVKHNANREMANAYLAAKDYNKALTYAKNDLSIRPENIDANELVAWIYYQKGDYANAKLHTDKALKMNTKNPTTLYKSGLIYAQAGDAAKGNALILEAQKAAPFVDKKMVLAAK